MSKHKKMVYQEPRITRIKLDPAQAVLQQCAIGGFYFSAGGTACYTTNAGTPETFTRFTCPLSIRGNNYKRTTFFTPWLVSDTQPS